MKKILFICASLFIALLYTGCFRNDIRVGEYLVPNMTAQACLDVLTARLKAVEGVQDVKADFSTGTVYVTFDGLKAALKNIEFVIAGTGFDVNDTPGAPEAKATLPPGCR